jgi:cyanophycinase
MAGDAIDGWQPGSRSPGTRFAQVAGPLALIGGAEWRTGCDFDRDLLELSGGREVLVLPTAAAYEHPDRAVEAAQRWFDELGATVRPLRVLTRRDAVDEANVTPISEAAFVYLSGGSPMHLRSVLKESPVWDALVAAWQRGAVLAGSGSGAMVLCDPMVDPRGGALTLGLGLLEQVAIIPHHDTWSEDKAKRTLRIAPKGLPIAGVDERTALIRDPDGTWRVAGAGVYVDGHEVGTTALP